MTPPAILQLLQTLISTPSFSREETATADVIFDYLTAAQLSPKRHLNNVYAFGQHNSPQKKTLLLCSHHDTVRPAAGYTRDPFAPDIQDGKLYGLGSNDAGASVVSLIDCFSTFYNKNLPFNLVLAIVAEEEVQGPNGVESILPLLGKIDCAIVGEPTQMQAAVGERGLMVLDCTAHGVQGHAARNEGKNALYLALDDIEWIRQFAFPKISATMGQVKMTATMMQCGTQHNVVPAECKFVVDVRPTDAYSNEEILQIIQQHCQSTVTPRSTRLRASSIAAEHPLVQAAVQIGCSTYISPTTSDIALLHLPALKMGVGDSARSHAANEFVYLHEIDEGIARYKQLIDSLRA
ncbi:acetylornithine deacetylase [Bacteroidia bacterium]|nr:acetylornithine deacetylase [Bacteroidia bacterium]